MVRMVFHASIFLFAFSKLNLHPLSMTSRNSSSTTKNTLYWQFVLMFMKIFTLLSSLGKVRLLLDPLLQRLDVLGSSGGIFVKLFPCQFHKFSFTENLSNNLLFHFQEVFDDLAKLLIDFLS